MANAAGDSHEIVIYGAHFRVSFPMLDADGDLVTGATTPDSEVSQDGGTFADCSNEATELATSSGMYYLDLIGTETDNKQCVVIVKSATAGMKTTPIVLYPERLAILASGTAQAGGASTITLAAATSKVDNDMAGLYVFISNDSPSGAQYQVRKIISNVASTQVATVDSAWGTNPSNASTYNLLSRMTANVSSFAGTLPPAIAVAGYQDVNTVKWANTAITATSIPVATAAGAAGGLFIAGINATTTITTALTTTFTGNLTGSVASVTGAVGSVTGAVGSIATGGIAAASFAAGAIDAAAIATDAIGALELAAGAASEIAAAVWDLDATAHQTQGTFGQVLGDSGADTDSVWSLTNTNLDATISSRLASASYTAPTNLTTAQIATGVWTDTTAGDFTTALSIGKSVMNGVSLGTGLTINAYTGNTPQTGDSFARIRATGSGLTSIISLLPTALTANGNIKASFQEILTTALTETSGQLAGGFKKFFNVVAPTGTVNSIPDVVPGGVNGLVICGSNNPITFATFGVNGLTTLNALTISNNLIVSGNLEVVGNVTFDGTTTLTGAVSATNASNDIRGIQTKDFTAAALAKFFTLDTTKTFVDAIGGSVVKEIADNGGGGPSAATIAGAVWDLDATSHQTQGSFGQVLGDSGATANSIWGLANTNLNATVGSRSSHSAADVWTVGTRVLTAGTNIALAKGVGVTGFNDIAAADVWLVATRVLTAGTNIALAKGVGVTGFNDIVATDVWAAATRALTAGTNIALAKGVGVTGFNDIAAVDVWGVATRVLTAGTNIVLAKGAGITGFNDIAAGAAMTLTIGERNSIADALLDRADGVETGITPRNALRYAASRSAGEVSGAGTGTETFYACGNPATTRMVFTVDTNGNISNVTLS